nr:hypothetical protein [Tanacetum cinerariifolium]
VKVDDPNITIVEYIRLGEEKARRRGKVFNWEIATHGKIWDYKDVYYLRSIEIEFPAIVFNDMLTSEAALSCEPTTDIKNLSKDFSIDYALFVGQKEFIRICVVDLVDSVPELLYKYFRDFCKDSECLEARGVLDHINND